MLVLSRKCLESVAVGGVEGQTPGFRVTVLEIRRGRVKLGIEADADVPIQRGEIRDRNFNFVGAGSAGVP
jgi:carbon storage regulator CsrA